MYGDGILGGNDFGEIKIEFGNDIESDDDDLMVYLGFDDSC